MSKETRKADTSSFSLRSSSSASETALAAVKRVVGGGASSSKYRSLVAVLISSAVHFSQFKGYF